MIIPVVLKEFLLYNRISVQMDGFSGGINGQIK